MKIKQKEPNPYVRLAMYLAAVSLLIVIVFVIFAKENIAYLNQTIWAVVVLGISLGLFQYRSQKKVTT